MKRASRALLAVALIAVGALGAHFFGLTFNQSASPAPGAEAASTTQTTSNRLTTGTGAVTVPASASSIDTITRQAYAIASPSVVYVNSVGQGTGSGVIYDSNGDIVTNAHVVQGATQIRVTLSTGRTLTARLLGTDTADDLAVIHVNATGLPAAHFATAGSYGPAQTVLAIGNPLGFRQSVTSGLISGLGRTVQEPGGAYLPDSIQTSAPINPGNSGGALVTLDGTVVGIPTLEQTGTSNGQSAQDIGFAIPSPRVVSVASQIIASGKVTHTGRSFLGVSVGDPTGQYGNPFGGGNTAPSVQGATVNSVASGSPAATAGLQQGDTITRFNNTSITSTDDLLTALAHTTPGQTVTLTVDRNGSTMTLHVHLSELPATQ